LRVLPPEMIIELKRPFGELLKNNEIDRESLEMRLKGELILTCGDETTLKLNELGFKINLAIVDNKTKRSKKDYGKKLANIGNRTVHVKNRPGTISDEMSVCIENEISKCEQDRNNSVMIIVDGEEDLAFIPCVIHSPVGTNILYGQPDEGMVVSEVDKALKDKILNIYDRMPIAQ
jgi:GTP-dependent dephospho-CoA kinase